MNAKEMMLAYAAKHNNGRLGLTNEQWCGKLVAEGICLSRFPRVNASATRTGRTIVITETTVSSINEIIDGRLVTKTVETPVEVMRIDL